MDHSLEFISNHYLLFLALAVVIVLLIQDLLESALSPFKSLSPMLAVAKMNQTEVLVIDVREPPEFVLGHIENAVNAPKDKLLERIDSIARDKKQVILVACQSGTRSLPACKLLHKAGFEQVFNLAGGMQAWEDNKLPIKIPRKK